MPAISPVSSDGGADVMKIGLAIPGGPPTLNVGVGVGRPGSAGDGWTGMGAEIDGDGASRGAAAEPHDATEIRNAARTGVLTTQAY
jgi:hypothetical protein